MKGRTMKLLLMSLVLALAVVGIAQAGERTVTDNDGDKWVIDTETAATPGAGAGLGAVVGAVGDTIPGYQGHRFDLQIGISAFGIGADDSMNTESAETGATLYYRPATWNRIGANMTWDTVDRSKLDFGLLAGFKLYPDPWSSVIWWCNLDLLPHFIVRTDDTGAPRTSAWSYFPKVGMSVEVPMNTFSFEVGAGAGVPLTLEGINKEAENAALTKLAAGVDVAINFRWR